MSDDVLRVELVAADRVVWSGEATNLIARTVEGDVGILANHAPMLSLMVEGVVEIETTDNETWVAAVESGFLSVAENRVSVLSEQAEMSHDIDFEQAKRDLEQARQTGSLDLPAEQAVRRAEARIRAVEIAG
ncbi:F0F1 ATP synthase subunit epsilon [Solicola gregarius]|uniref:ATP synthase epsilon chain n=1 Tax=Solicola gregarius TaxID=2908642 RepID=A0AA46TK98_9ACTN|nr:F0F1 ATP synthase subunit epsilon [Solicola gregarius]UYM05978.1 F0F1 ATP synthase subunit epsilon [Solicola gregarius]